jgi:DNA-binding transcriptional MerR regulator
MGHKIPVLIHPKEAAKILGRPESTLRYWRSLGVGPAWVKLEGRVLYDEQDLVEYIQRSRRTPSVRAYMEEHDGAL